MGAFIVKRLYYGLYVVLGVTIVVFLVTRVIGDPVSAMLPMESSAAQRALFAQQLGLDRPLYLQFLDFLGNVARLDLGESLWQRRPVTQIVLEKLPMTLYLVGAGMALAIALAIPLGMLAALAGRHRRPVDRAVQPARPVGPVLAVSCSSSYSRSICAGCRPPAGDLRHMVLPAITLARPPDPHGDGGRSSMMDELNAQYIKVAIAKGLPFRRVIGVHALRNITVPTMTLAGWEVIRALAGYSVVVETVFAWPGLGLAAMQAIERQDLILLQGIVFYVAIMVVLINIALDVAQKFVDPRVKFG
jgi:peptide/nickel transport system permease protein